MGRARSIDRDAVLDATERVVTRQGVVGLSIDAVATEAGISKSSVLYDYKSKSGLIQAVVERRLAADRLAIEQAVAACADTPEPEIYGRVRACGPAPNERELAVVVALSAAVASDEALRRTVEAAVTEEIGRVRGRARKKDAAELAYLALQGLLFFEYFAFHHWSDSDRARILANIQALSCADLPA